MKYIDADKLKDEIRKHLIPTVPDRYYDAWEEGEDAGLLKALDIIDSLQQEQPNNMIQWTGNNLKEVIDFTGKSPRFGEWFKSWEEYENYVHTHNDILKLFCDDGSHFEVSVGAWIIKTPDGYNVPSVARFIHAKQEQPEVNFEDVKYLLDKVKYMSGYWMKTNPNCAKIIKDFNERLHIRKEKTK